MGFSIFRKALIDFSKLVGFNYEKADPTGEMEFTNLILEPKEELDKNGHVFQRSICQASANIKLDNPPSGPEGKDVVKAANKVGKMGLCTMDNKGYPYDKVLATSGTASIKIQSKVPPWMVSSSYFLIDLHCRFVGFSKQRTEAG